MSRTAPLILLTAMKAATLAVWEELLIHVGYATIACQTAHTAQQWIDANLPDLLLTERDLEWYEAGWDLLYIVRQHPGIGVLPVVLHTTDRHWLHMHQQQLQAWECQILIHPFSAAELWTVVATALTPASLHSRAVGE